MCVGPGVGDLERGNHGSCGLHIFWGGASDLWQFDATWQKGHMLCRELIVHTKLT